MQVRIIFALIACLAAAPMHAFLEDLCLRCEDRRNAELVRSIEIADRDSRSASLLHATPPLLSRSPRLRLRSAFA